MTLTISGASLTKELLVTNLAVTDIDPVNDTISGTTEPDQMMWMWFESSCCRNFQADSSGNWMVDYSVPGADGEPIADIQPGSSGTINAVDNDGDNTSVNWSVPNPSFNVRANENKIEGWQWPIGSTVTIEVSRPGESISRTATVVAHAPWDPNSDSYVEYYFTGEFDILAGDVVSVTQGATTKTTTVTNLAFTDIDLDTDIVTGIASPGANVRHLGLYQLGLQLQPPCHCKWYNRHLVGKFWQCGLTAG